MEFICGDYLDQQNLDGSELVFDRLFSVIIQINNLRGTRAMLTAVSYRHTSSLQLCVELSCSDAAVTLATPAGCGAELQLNRTITGQVLSVSRHKTLKHVLLP